MIEQKPNRRAGDGSVNVLAERIDGLCVDMNEMKHGIAKMADALTKLAIVEERQTQTILAQERAFFYALQGLERACVQRPGKRPAPAHCRQQRALGRPRGRAGKGRAHASSNQQMGNRRRVGCPGAAGIVHRAARP